MAYDYMDAISTGIKDYILESVEPGSMTEEKLFQYLSDETAMNKGVLVFDYGGYVYANEAHAKEYVDQNKQLVENAYDFLGIDNLANDIENGQYKAMDTVVRFYVFVDAIAIAIELIDKEDLTFFKSEDDEG